MIACIGNTGRIAGIVYIIPKIRTWGHRDVARRRIRRVRPWSIRAAGRSTRWVRAWDIQVVDHSIR
ncbi:MAG: hypothetical protein AAGU23_03830 [Bacillota bacterium]